MLTALKNAILAKMSRIDRDRGPNGFAFQPDEEYIKYLTGTSHRILQNPEEVFDLAGKRFALLCLLYKKHFLHPENTFRVAVVGNPNLGKTTYSSSIFKIFKHYNFPTGYVDLDLYTQSGKAMFGEVAWDKRPKRGFEQVRAEETHESIESFRNAAPGIIIADFPGHTDDSYQVDRLKAANLALILANDIEEKKQWEKLCQQVCVGYRFLISLKNGILINPVFPQIHGLNRKVILSPAMLTSATSILEEAVEMSGVSKQGYEQFFTQPELVVLQEYLDFLFSIQMP